MDAYSRQLRNYFPGCRVRVVGLVRAAEHNGKFGTILRPCEERGSDRLVVALDFVSKPIKIKFTNLEAIATRVCSGCERALPRESFSGKQWKAKAAARRCAECVSTTTSAPAECGAPSAPSRLHTAAEIDGLLKTYVEKHGIPSQPKKAPPPPAPASEEEPDTCTICLSELGSGRREVLRCGHAFHARRRVEKRRFDAAAPTGLETLACWIVSRFDAAAPTRSSRDGYTHTRVPDCRFDAAAPTRIVQGLLHTFACQIVALTPRLQRRSSRARNSRAPDQSLRRAAWIVEGICCTRSRAPDRRTPSGK